MIAPDSTVLKLQQHRILNTEHRGESPADASVSAPAIKFMAKLELPLMNLHPAPATHSF